MRSARPLPISETDFQTQVVQLARICGWTTMHVRRTIGRGRRWTTSTSVSGWPDLAIWRPGRFLAVEIKTDAGTVTPEQADVLESLRGAGIDARVWRPRDWDEIQTTLNPNTTPTITPAPMSPS